MEREEKKLTPERVLFLLNKKNIQLTLEEAAAVADFMNLMAEIVVQQYFRNKKKSPVDE